MITRYFRWATYPSRVVSDTSFVSIKSVSLWYPQGVPAVSGHHSVYICMA